MVFADSGFGPMKMRKLWLFGGWAKPMAVESSSVAEPATKKYGVNKIYLLIQ